MGIKNWQEITIDSETFDQMREQFDVLMQRMFKKMEQNNSDEGSMSMKLTVNTNTDYVEDEHGDAQRIEKPVFKYNITMQVPVKDSLDGRKDTGMILVFDDELKRWVLKYASVGGQRSMFDDDFPDIVNGEANEVPAIGENLMLEDKSAESDNGGTEAVECEYEVLEGEKEINVADGGTESTDGIEEDEDYEYEE